MSWRRSWRRLPHIVVDAHCVALTPAAKHDVFEASSKSAVDERTSKMSLRIFAASPPTTLAMAPFQNGTMDETAPFVADASKLMRTAGVSTIKKQKAATMTLPDKRIAILYCYRNADKVNFSQSKDTGSWAGKGVYKIALPCHRRVNQFRKTVLPSTHTVITAASEILQLDAIRSTLRCWLELALQADQQQKLKVSASQQHPATSRA